MGRFSIGDIARASAVSAGGAQAPSQARGAPPEEHVLAWHGSDIPAYHNQPRHKRVL